MTQYEFIRKTPDLIKHKCHGMQYLETTRYRGGVMACYRGDNKLASFGTYGKSWQEVFDRLSKLIQESSLVE